MSSMWTRWGVVGALLTSSVLGVMKPGPPVENALAAGKPALEPPAPAVIKLDLCGGSFKAVIDGVVMGLVLGMQIHLPASDDVFEMWHLSRQVSDLYTYYWCLKNGTAVPNWPRSAWCQEHSYDPFYYPGSDAAVEAALKSSEGAGANATTSSVEPMAMMDMGHLLSLRRKLLKVEGQRRKLLDMPCSAFSLKVDESDAELWDIWWRVSDALDFAVPVKTSAALFVGAIEGYGEVSRQRAEAHGFPPPGRPPLPGHAFNMLHLRGDQAWVHHCSSWMGRKDGVHRDNCMNNTQSIAAVLVTEGLDPRLPLYVDTHWTVNEFAEMGMLGIEGQYGRGLLGLTEAFTVITKGTILNDLEIQSNSFRPEQWGAVDMQIAAAASDYVGNSVADESALIIMMRQRNGRSAWHYNGGSVPLQDSGALRPHRSLSVQTFREPLKWVFAIHVGGGELSHSFVDMVKVAVLSARAHTSLVPVCMTTADPNSTISVWLVSQGVRVVHHTPAWAPAMLRKVRDLQNSTVYEELRARSHLYTDPDAMVGTFMRIDIPVLGILDEFVLYTDVDVVFKSEIDWSVLLAGADLDAVYGANDFARGRQNFSEPGRQGLPLYFAASSEIEQSEDPGMMNAGVMLMNLRSLRQTYESFKDFIFSDPDLQWDEGPGDQGAIKSFYSDLTGQPHGNFLPWVLNWKPYWAPNADAKLIHFHGPKCSLDIEPYTQTKVAHIEVFGSLLERCTQSGDCVNLCHEFDSYLRLLA